MRLIPLFIIGFCCSIISHAQNADTAIRLSDNKKIDYLNTLSARFDKINKKIISSTGKTLRRSQKQDQKIYKRLLKKDSTTAKEFLRRSNEQYAAMQEKLANAAEGKSVKELKEYNKYFDTIKTSLAFLQQHTGADNSAISSALDKAKLSSQAFETAMQASNEIKRQLAKRTQQLSTDLSKCGVGKHLNKLKGESYTLKQQLQGYKEILKDRKKLEKTVLSKLRSNEKFTAFVKKNSILAQLFKLPEGQNGTGNAAGLQTISSVQAQIDQRYGSSGFDPQQYVQQQTNQAQAEMNKLKGKLKKLGKNSNDTEVPKGYNSQKARSFLQRLTYETNFHTQKLQVTMTDIALTVGYKLNDKSVFSIGGSARIGLGKDWNNIRFTHEGFGLCSVLDWKLKHSIWLTGSYETNYYNRFNTYTYANAWQANILLGLMKKVQFNAKKSSTVRLSYNTLYKQNNFLTQPIVVKVGYGF